MSAILRHMMSFLVDQRFAVTHVAHIYHLCGDSTAQMMSLMKSSDLSYLFPLLWTPTPCGLSTIVIASNTEICLIVMLV